MHGERLIFDQMMEGMFLRGVGKSLTPVGKQRLREAGFNPDRKALPSYPVAIWEKCLDVAIGDLYPQVPRDEALRLLGERFIDGYQDTLVGKALAPLARIIGMKRALHRLTQTFRSGNNFMEARITDLGPTASRVFVSDVHHQPTWMQGVLIAGSRFMGVKEISVTCDSAEGDGCHYTMKWA